LALVVDASVGLKWFLPEPDSVLAAAPHSSEPNLWMPDFWLHEVTNVLWREVRRQRLTPEEARDGLALLKAQVEPVPTSHMNLHDHALEIGIAINHSPYDTMYVAFAIVVGATAVIASDAQFVRDMRTHPDAALASMVVPLDDWAISRGIRR
jgi:predicted nucleic acid-binding protein